MVNSYQLWGCSNGTCNTVIIMTTYSFIGKFDKWPVSDAITLGNIVVPPLVLNKIPFKQDTDSEENTSKYIVPALRQRKVLHSTNQRGILGSLPSRTIQGMQKPAFRDPSITRIVIEEMPANLIPSDEVEPCFRTPSNYYKFSQKSKLT